MLMAAAMKTIQGAMVKVARSAWSGVASSLASTLKPWIVLWNMPHGPMRLGPKRSCIWAMIFISIWMTMKAVGTVSSSSRVVARTNRPRPSTSSIYLSTPPITGSRLAMTAMVSAIRCPGMSAGMTCSVMNDGSRIRNRYGVGPPSLMAYTE